MLKLFQVCAYLFSDLVIEPRLECLLGKISINSFVKTAATSQQDW